MRIRDIADAPLAAASLSADSWSDAGTQLRTAASSLTEAGAFPGWTGDAASAMGGRVCAAAGRTSDAGDAAATTADLLALHCRILTGIQAEVLAVIRLAEAAGMTVHADGRVTAGTGSVAGIAVKVLDAVPGAGNAVDAAEATFTVLLRASMIAVQALDVALAAKVTGTLGGLSAGPDGIPAEIDPGAAGSTALSPDRVSEGVRIDAELDASLTPERRAEVLEIAEGAAEELRLRGIDPADMGVTALAVDGQLAVIVGDIDTGDKITTLVAGTGSDGPGGLRDSAALAGRITGPGQATVTWHGYAAPPDLPAAAGSGRAEAGGTALRGFQQRLRERNPDARLSIVGHSYGTRVIDEAAGDDVLALEADEIHLMGSPGMTADSASDLRLQATDGHAEVHVYRAEGDIIGLAAGVPFLHGDDPADADWGADFLNGEDLHDRSPLDLGRDVVDGATRSSGPLGALGDALDGAADNARDMWDGLWGLRDGDAGDEHSSYRTDERVLEELRK